MPEEVKPDPKQATTQDAELAAENMAEGEEKAPSVDFNADYQAAQEFSVSDVDHTGTGAKLAKEATAPEQTVFAPQQTKGEAKSTANPEDYMGMAGDLSSTEAPVAGVSDDLIKEAIDKGTPGQ